MAVLELQEPFKSNWKKGYLRYSNKDNRGRVDLYNSESDRTTISYARYLKSVELGYEIPEGYEVDHKDNDKTNDKVSNLQLMTEEKNKLKEQLRYIEEEQVSYGYYCANCNASFLLTERERKMRLAQNVEMAFCSRSCAFTYHALRNPSGVGRELDEETKAKIRHMRRELNYTSYRIANELEISRNTVMKYW